MTPTTAATSARRFSTRGEWKRDYLAKAVVEEASGDKARSVLAAALLREVGDASSVGWPGIEEERRSVARQISGALVLLAREGIADEESADRRGNRSPAGRNGPVSMDGGDQVGSPPEGFLSSLGGAQFFPRGRDPCPFARGEPVAVVRLVLFAVHPAALVATTFASAARAPYPAPGSPFRLTARRFSRCRPGRDG